MWNSTIVFLENETVLKYTIDKDGVVLLFKDVITLWQSDNEFRTYFIGLLKDAPFDGYFWETPPITKHELARPFEFVLVYSSLFSSLIANKRSFAEHFGRTSDFEDVVSFLNLGKDARLVVPCPINDDLDYPHLAAFVRNAPDVQLHEFWKCVGYHMEHHVSEKYTWLSTAGLGVYWLHIRLDSRPKYYRFTPYKTDFWK